MKTLLNKIIKHWNTFFFEPISPATIGLFRIFFGITCFLSILGKFPFREIFYGDKAILTPASTKPYFVGPEWFYFRFVPHSDPELKYYFIVFLIAIVFLTIGFLTRFSSILVFLGFISLSNINFAVDNAGDDIMRINALFLMFTQAGAAYSVDRWIRRKRGIEGPELKLVSPWAQRILQIQLAYLYFDTATLKLEGDTWREGTAMYYALGYIEHFRFNLKYLFYWPWQIYLVTWGTLVAEYSMAFLVWFRKLRYVILPGAFALHFMINLTMQFPVFQYVMMASLINFIYPEDVERAVAWIKSKITLRIVKKNEQSAA